MTINRQALMGLVRKTERVPVPALGEDVIVQELSLAEQNEFFLTGADADGTFDTKKMRALCIIAATVDEQGNHLFGYGDLSAVMAMPASVMAAVGDAAIRMCGLATAAQTTEELAKN
jgi:hypothetical protein